MKTAIGAVFGRWTVTAAQDGRRVECACACGTVRHVYRNSLLSGASTSCGCLQREHAASAKRTHGMSDTPTYISWSSMMTRCSNPMCKSYPQYGGRGITVCERWLKFENFLEDMGERATTGLSLDRVDNSKGYEPGNCVWATRKTQAVNTRRTRLRPDVVLQLRAGAITTAQAIAMTGASKHAISMARRGKTWVDT